MLDLIYGKDGYNHEEISVTRYLCDTLSFVVRSKEEEQNLIISMFFTENAVLDREIDKISIDAPNGDEDWVREKDDNEDARNNDPFEQFVEGVVEDNFSAAKEKDKEELVKKILTHVLGHLKLFNIEGIY